MPVPPLCAQIVLSCGNLNVGPFENCIEHFQTFSHNLGSDAIARNHS